MVSSDLLSAQSCNSWYQLKQYSRVSDAIRKADVNLLFPTAFFCLFVFVLNMDCRCATLCAVMSDTVLTKYTRQEIAIYQNTQGISLIGFHKPQISLHCELLLIIIFKTLFTFECLVFNLFHVNTTLLFGPRRCVKIMLG